MDGKEQRDRGVSTIDAYSPAEIAERVEHQGVTKATLPLFPTVMLGMAVVLIMAGHPDLHEGGLRTYALEVRVAKAQEDFGTAFFRGILGNLLVCIAVWVSMGGRSITDKFIAPLLPIAAVSICGFEHCVGNLYYLAMAILIHVTHADHSVGLPLGIWFLDSIRNLLAVTLGNILGGSGLVALVYHAVYRRTLQR